MAPRSQRVRRSNLSVLFYFQGTESEQESRSNSDPHSFVNHYANVNSTFRHTWKKQKPVAVPVPRAGTALVSSGTAAAAAAAAATAAATNTSARQQPSAATGHNAQNASSVVRDSRMPVAPIPGTSRYIMRAPAAIISAEVMKTSRKSPNCNRPGVKAPSGLSEL